MPVDFDGLNAGPLITLLGDPVSYEAGGVSYSVNAIYSAPSTFVDGPSGDVYTTSPELFIRGSDLPANTEPSRGHKVKVRGKRYQVLEAKSDGEGSFNLELKADTDDC